MPSAQITISQLPSAGPITGTELVPVVQNGLTVHTTTAAISSSPNQTQTFLTANQEPSLPNSRALSANNGVTLVDGGAQSALTIGLTGTALSLQNASGGLLYKVAGSIVPRVLLSGSSGLSVTNGNGVSGDPTVSLTGRPLSLQSLGGSSGMVALTAGGVTSVDLQGTANQITVTNGAGPGNPTFAIADNPVLPGTGGFVPPSGTTAERPPVPTNGLIRFNTDILALEVYDGGWVAFPTGFVEYAVTFDSSGGSLPGSSFNGSSALTVDYSTVGAPKTDGTDATGTWGIDITGNADTATDAANVATTATATNADFFIPFVPNSTTSNQALGIDAGLSYNPSTNAITGGVSGGTF